MIVFGSVIFYLLIFFISSFLLGIGSNKKNLLLIIIALSLPILLATFRYGIGTDYFNYFRNFLNAEHISLIERYEIKSVVEIFRFLMLKIGLIFNNYSVVLGLYAVLSIVIIYFAINNDKNKAYIGTIFFLYLCIYYPSSLNVMAQFVAIPLVAYSFKYIFKKQIYRYTIIIFIASLFHTTAIIAYPVYFLWNEKKVDLISKWKIVLVILSIVAITFNYQGILEIISQVDVFSNYVTYVEENDTGNNRDLILKIVLFLMVFMLRKPLIRYDSKNKLYILLILFNMILGFTGFSSPWVKRASLYFEIVQLFMVPSLIQIFRNKNDKFLIYLLIISYAIVYFILVYYIIGNSDVLPYEFSL